MALATTILTITRIRDADTTRSARVLPTMGTAVHIPTVTCSAQIAAAVSLWTVLELGVPIAPVSMTRKTTRMRDADSIQ